MNQRIRLDVIGLSYSPMKSGAFALLLGVRGNKRLRIPVVIGAPEAQSIALYIESIHAPRPMTHDLFSTFAHAFGIELKEVFIYKFEDGIYSSELTFTNGETTVQLDSRTSDAVAIAMRTDAPIYTTREIVDECGIIITEEPFDDDSEETDQEHNEQDDASSFDGDELADSNFNDISIPDLVKEYSADPILDADLDEDLENELTDSELQRRMEHLTAIEDYEHAARTAEILRRRQENNSDDES